MGTVAPPFVESGLRLVREDLTLTDDPFTWETDREDYKEFKPMDEWSKLITKAGFTDAGKRLLQANDPSDNTLVLFTKN